MKPLTDPINKPLKMETKRLVPAKLAYSGFKVIQMSTSISATATEIAADTAVSTLKILEMTNRKSFIFFDTNTKEFQS